METRSIVHDKDTYVVPDHWSDNAATVFVTKYCRSHHNEFCERSVRDVFKRLVEFWVEDDPVLQVELYQDLWDQFASPNSPQYFNAGIKLKYGITSNNIGLSYIKDSGVYQATDTYTHPQLHACFIQPIDDSLPGILTLLANEARLFSRGSGTGTNFSSLRATGERLQSGGTSSGLISFLKVFDVSAGAIKSGGTTRRAAKMVVLNDDHPDLIKFIQWKEGEERKAKVLAKAGYGNDWQSESYQTVAGQNSNNSICITDKFMTALKDKQMWELKGRTDNRVNIHVYAPDIWEAICSSAWYCADPGVQYTDTINKWNTTPLTGRINASNPCSEHLRLDNSACNLASINLLRLLEGNKFDVDQYCRLISRWTQVLNRSIDLAGYPSHELADGARRCRDIGLGYCGLGALLMRIGVAYDSDEGRLIASLITSLLTAGAYLESTKQAEVHGPYPEFHKNKQHHLAVIGDHQVAMRDVFIKTKKANPISQELADRAVSYWMEVTHRAERFGVRNAQLTVIAPTGTIGLTMECETTGVEPVFAPRTVKTLAGGGLLEQSADSIQIALASHGYESLADVKRKHVNLFRTAIGDNCLTPEAHVKMVAAVQPHISGGISKTVNLPNSATVRDIDKIYRLAHKLGVKCISVYRDGCKSQPLNPAECKTCGDGEVCEI